MASLVVTHTSFRLGLRLEFRLCRFPPRLRPKALGWVPPSIPGLLCGLHQVIKPLNLSVPHCKRDREAIKPTPWGLNKMVCVGFSDMYVLSVQ